MNATTPEAFLVVRDRRDWSDVFKLSPEVLSTVGRDSNNQVVLQDDRCSRRHCQFYRGDEYWYVRDLNSRNGTEVNGQKIEGDQLLGDGDRVRIGQTDLLFTCDISRPLDELRDAGLDEEASDDSAIEDVETSEPQILERKSQTRYVTESGLAADQIETGVRGAFAHLYNLIVQMVSATDVRSVTQTVLEGLLSFIGADIGAVLLFPDPTDQDATPDQLRIISYHAPEGAPYQLVSTQLSQTALNENEAILAMDIRAAGAEGEFQTLNQIDAQSVICAPIRRQGIIFGLLHLYSLDSNKPLDADALEFTLAVADQLAGALVNLAHKETLSVGLQNAHDENKSLRRLLEVECELVGDSNIMRILGDTIARVASSDATALVRGESGVGKELVARAIHFNSNRREGPFVCLNCAALTETLLESELFGHEKGAFTGATDQKIGKFERADSGTLFLDEVGEMPPSIQAKFLRVLEGHPFERVGGNTSVQVDVRVVAATNRKLEEAVEEGNFRSDLFYRLQILEIDVPPLREHATDIPLLAVHFLDRCCERLGMAQSQFSQQAMETLCKHEWPGNVRELRNVIERAVVLADGPEIVVEDLRFSTLHGKATWKEQDEVYSYEAVSLEEIERQHIAETMAWTNWKKREAARILGINRSTLDRKLERYAIAPPGGLS